MTINPELPTVGGDVDKWGGKLNAALEEVISAVNAAASAAQAAAAAVQNVAAMATNAKATADDAAESAAAALSGVAAAEAAAQAAQSAAETANYWALHVQDLYQQYGQALTEIDQRARSAYMGAESAFQLANQARNRGFKAYYVIRWTDDGWAEPRPLELRGQVVYDSLGDSNATPPTDAQTGDKWIRFVELP